MQISASGTGAILAGILCLSGFQAEAPKAAPPAAKKMSDYGVSEMGDRIRAFAVIDGALRMARGSSEHPEDIWRKLGTDDPFKKRVMCNPPPQEGADKSKPAPFKPGEAPLPDDYRNKDRSPNEAKYPGSSLGGCGVFAVLQCDDILEHKAHAVTPKRWKKTSKKLGSSDGGTGEQEIGKYYKDKGYCSIAGPVRPGSHRRVKRLKVNGCDCKLFLDGPEPAKKHVEVITGVEVDDDCFITNHWGVEASVCGFDEGGGSGLALTPKDKPRDTSWTQAHWRCFCKDKKDCENGWVTGDWY
jgi:hypothetical protein